MGLLKTLGLTFGLATAVAAGAVGYKIYNNSQTTNNHKQTRSTQKESKEEKLRKEEFEFSTGYWTPQNPSKEEEKTIQREFSDIVTNQSSTFILEQAVGSSISPITAVINTIREIPSGNFENPIFDFYMVMPDGSLAKRHRLKSNRPATISLVYSPGASSELTYTPPHAHGLEVKLFRTNVGLKHIDTFTILTPEEGKRLGKNPPNLFILKPYSSANLLDKRIPTAQTFRIGGRGKDYAIVIVEKSKFRSKIAFLRDSEIHLMDADGKDQTQITNNRERISGLIWSRDGSQLIYTRERSIYNNYPIFAINTKNYSQTQLTDLIGIHSYPLCSDDGNTILFGYRERLGVSSLNRIDRDGSNRTQLAENICFDNSFNIGPNGEIVFAARWNGETNIFLSDINASDPINLTNNSDFDRRPNISPDGNWISYVSSNEPRESGIYVMRIDGSEKRRLTPENLFTSEDDLVWSQDSSMIAYSVLRGELGRTEIEVIELNKEGIINLTNTPYSNERSPTWNPDGTEVAFDCDKKGNSGIYAVNPFTKEKRLISKDAWNPVWSPILE
jgi:Tol biopolymer transport system component